MSFGTYVRNVSENGLPSGVRIAQGAPFFSVALGETASDFARRSQRDARGFIEDHHANDPRDWLYALDFTDQQDAA